MGIGSRTVSGVLILTMTVLTFGCATAQRHPTRTGAATGAAVGAGAGALIDDDKPWRGALIGAAIGGLAGAGVGTMIRRQRDAYNRIEQLEVQEQAVILPESAPVAGQEPERRELQALMLRLQSDVLFPVGSSTLSAQGASKIREIANVMQEYPESDALIRGYTSSEGGDQLNYELSQRRAEVVRNELIANGVAPARLTAQGMGPSHPIGDNSTEAGRVMNRRVEIHVIPHEQP
jgi:outer membrane protein OmpA-like peptidoglycan-associated protein